MSLEPKSLPGVLTAVCIPIDQYFCVKMASSLSGSRKFDVPGSKKFEVPVELHRVLGNQFAVDQHEKKERRRRKRAEARAEAKKLQEVPSVNEYFNSAAMHKQVELELQLERLRVSMRHPPPNLDNSSSDPTNHATEIPSRGSTSTPAGHQYQQVQYYNSDTPNDPAHLTADNADDPALTPAPPAGKKAHGTHHHGRHKKAKPTKTEPESITEESQSRTNSFDGEHVVENTPQHEPNPVAPVQSAAPTVEAVASTPVVQSHPASHPASQQSARAESAVSYTNDSPMLNSTYPAYAMQPQYGGGIPYPTPRNTLVEAAQPQSSFPDITRVGFGLAMPANSQQYLQHQYGQTDNHVHINQMYSPMTGSSGGGMVFPNSQQTQPYNHMYQAPQGYYPASASQGAQIQNNAKVGNMFVLSSAPKMSYEQMVAQDIKDFYAARQFNAAAQAQQSAPPQSQQSQASGRAGQFSSGSQLEHSPLQERNAQYGFNPHHSTMQDQIYRYAEIRSLFEMPAADQPLMRSQMSPRGMSSEDPSSQAKLNDSIDRHRQRIMRSRQSQPTKTKANTVGASPRGKIHRVRNPATSAQYQQSVSHHPHHQQSHHDHGSVSGSVHHNQQHYPPSSAPHSPADGTRKRMSSMDGLSMFGSTFSDVTSDPHHNHHHQEHKVNTSANHSMHSHSHSHGHSHADSHADSHASHLLNNPTPFVTTKELSALLDVPQLHLDPSMTEFGQAVSANGSVVNLHSTNNSVALGSVAPKVTVEMSLEQFENATKRLNDQLRSTVAAVVHEELLKDVQAQHYTQRMQKATLAKSTQPLAKKIEEKVEEKLAELKKELEELRAVKLASPPKPVEPVVEEEDEDGEMEGGEFEEHAGNPDSWFLKNELGGRTNKPSKSSPKTNKHKSSPTQRHGHGHALSKLEAELDLDFTAISQDIKKSVEYVMKKHMHSYPSPQRTAGGAGGVGAVEAHSPTPVSVVPQESPRKEDVVSAPAPVPASTAAATAPPAATTTKKSKNKKSKTKESSENPAPVPAMTREPSFTNNVLSSIGSLFRANSTSSNPASSSPTAASVTKANPAPAGPARNGPPRPALNAIPDSEEEGYSEKNIRDDQTDDNSVSAMLREREQWERDITQAEINFDATARNLNALTEAKSSLKKELKDWQRDFEVRVGRPATDADKSAIEDRFLTYQKVTRDVKEAGRRHKDAEIALRALKEKE